MAIDKFNDKDVEKANRIYEEILSGRECTIDEIKELSRTFRTLYIRSIPADRESLYEKYLTLMVLSALREVS